ncbi:MAG: hypothetical protein HZA46_20145 [Planctomycetales bacterium]|nr:hypothetical protein [Planctomycetales bacterium]
MKTNINSFLGWCGLFGMAASYAGSFLGLVGEPLYVFCAFLAGVVLTAWSWYSAETDLEQAVGLAPPNRQRLHRASVTQRRGARLLFGTAVLSFVGVCFLEGTSVFNLADIRERIELQKRGNEADEIIMYVGPEDVVKYGKERVAFDVYKRPHLQWLQVEGINVVVEKYEPDPEPHGRLCSPMAFFRPPSVFFANIDDSVENGNRVFPTKHVVFTNEGIRFDPSALDPLVFIEDNKPETFQIRVNATKPGVYTYRLQVRMKYMWRKQCWYSNSRKCHFRFATSGKLSPTPNIELDAPPGPGTDGVAPAPARHDALPPLPAGTAPPA